MQKILKSVESVSAIRKYAIRVGSWSVERLNEAPVTLSGERYLETNVEGIKM